MTPIKPFLQMLAKCLKVTLAIALTGFVLVCNPMRSNAQNFPNQWVTSGINAAPSGATTLAWSKSDYSATDALLRETFQVWTLNASNAETSKTALISREGPWTISGGGLASDGSIRIAWVKPGTTSSGGVYSGDTLNVWVLTAGGVKTSEGPVYTKGAGWYMEDLIVMPDDTLRALWYKAGTTNSSGIYSGDVISFWALDTEGTETSKGPSLNKGQGWYFNGDFNENLVAPDGTLQVLWDTQPHSSTVAGKATVWTVDSTGDESAKGPVFSKAAGWYAEALGIAPDSTLRLLWLKGTSSNSADVSVWSLDSSGTATSEGPDYSVPNGNFNTNFVVASDGTSRFLWSTYAATDATITLWNFDSTGTLTEMGPIYSKGGLWSATDEGPFVEPDGSVQILWTLPPASSTATSGKASVWTLDSTGTETVHGPDYSF
jgi:hypothetical protein